jgi:hypothetical protein
VDSGRKPWQIRESFKGIRGGDSQESRQKHNKDQSSSLKEIAAVQGKSPQQIEVGIPRRSEKRLPIN